MITDLAATLARLQAKIPALTPEQLAVEAEAERVSREAERRRWLEEAGVLKRFLDASFETGRPLPALNRITKYLDGDQQAGKCLILTGPTGVGKTFAAVAALRALGRGHFWPFPSAAGALLDPARRSEALAQLKSSPFLVLDDLGSEFQKEGGLVQAFLDEIIYARHGNLLATIVTSNLTADDLKAHLSARIVDRLREWGSVFECPGQSLRVSPNAVVPLRRAVPRRDQG